MDCRGFVDLQVNGCMGVDFSSPDLQPEDFVRASRTLLERGTAAFLPTVITSDEETYRRDLALIGEAMERDEFRGRLLGFHIEGPFLSPEPGAVGAHNPAWVRDADPSFLDKLIAWAGDRIRILTVAAEVPGMPDLIRHAVARGITVSVGHSLATEDDLAAAAEAGARALTHLGNGLPNMVHRHRNYIWAALGEDRLAAMMIADGHHAPAALLKTVFRTKGEGNTLVVSDASALAGMPPGRYHAMGNDVIIEESGLLHNPEKGVMVGSSATILACVNHLLSLGFLSPEACVRAAQDTPLALIGMNREDVAWGPAPVYEAGKNCFRVQDA